MRRILGLRTFPVGVKIFTRKAEVAAVRAKGHRYCQALMRARYGEHILLGKEEIGCPVAAATFGFSPLPEAYKSGEYSLRIGIAKEKEIGARMYKKPVSFSPGEIEDVYLFPLEESIVEPDVVIVEDEVESIMWLLLACVNIAGGERIETSTAVTQAACLDCTAIPYKVHKINTSFGCYGCRIATDIGPNEALIGIPFAYFAGVADLIKFFSENAIPRCREKAAYKKLKEIFLKASLH
ncbi:MAG: hypothetical protein DSO07_07590 [Thermoproteota archaeon]|jgi:uncharacterized protein (DUF169 family)|uniref:DUF169 domain-containing protein n=1 Tax=Candidatus Methanodesulfokora washburnensis TaxID=2478471 RepID=A0A3R9PTQ5_9CREN|nr:DUF169 domain-containing protein [Candidatus Methanodesulfokores washburnensis]RSN72828.1 hypothetical protein D6D85_12335 [Candidatus Methanodesulfokores washburnensis]RZN63755.1 MAG: hypothetical protein EF810_00195 [Candidatus Methanodesulfokores washburnensis]TDA40889.1 MAG: hypothetical protein DSO07_07590 [Candidatus Korarchaeota archaeon]